MTLRAITLLSLALHGCAWDWDRFEPQPVEGGVCRAADPPGQIAVPSDAIAAPYGRRTIDGSRGDWGPLTVEAGELQEGEPPADAQDLRALFDLSWSEEWLYIYVEVDDDLIRVVESAFDRGHDGVEVMINSRGDIPCSSDAGEATLCADDHYLMMNAEGVFALSRSAVPPEPGDIELSATTEGGGRPHYSLELGLRWSYLLQQGGARASPAQTIGFDLAVIDSDAADSPPTLVMWRGAGNYQTDTRGYGRAVLVCDPDR